MPVSVNSLITFTWGKERATSKVTSSQSSDSQNLTGKEKKEKTTTAIRVSVFKTAFNI